MANTILSDFISNGEISLKGGDFEKICKEHSVDEIKEAFVTEVLGYRSIDLPMRKITPEEAREDFISLCDYKTSGLLKGETFTRYHYKRPLEGLYFHEKNTGNLASDYFHQEARYHASSQSEKSPASVWESGKSLRSVLNPIWTLKMGEITTKSLRGAIALRKYIASQFKPSVAKAVYEYFQCESTIDLSAGWGDRLAGFYSIPSAKKYVGVDPNYAVFKNYQKEADFFGEIVGKKEVSFQNVPAEEAEYERNSADLVFTSPPYFNAENYTYGIRDGKQSQIRYETLESWHRGFMFPALERAWEGLKENGHLVLNISDIYQKRRPFNTISKICDPMVDFILEKLKAKYVGCWGMKMVKRPNCHSFEKHEVSKDAVFCEPVWVFRK